MATSRRKAKAARARAKAASASASNARAPSSSSAIAVTSSSSVFVGGRLTRPTNEQVTLFGPFSLIAPSDPSRGWRTLSLDANTLSKIDATTLADYLLDLSPEVSRALWDFLRMCNAGWEAKAYTPGTEEIDETAQVALDDFVRSLDELYGSVDVVIGRLFLAMFVRGAFLAELVLDATATAPVDLVTPDPWVVRFRWREDELRGPVQQLCQWQNGRLVDLDRATIRYVPVDPLPGSPYGRPLISPSLFVALFLLVLLHDLRRVIQQQGYPRLDIEIVSEEVRKQMPDDVRDDPDELMAWMTKIFNDVSTAYANLKPDDTYVHDSKVKVNRPVGTVDSSSLGGVTGVIEALERMCIRALKTAPFMMATSESTTETQANRQWEAYLQGVKSIQHYAETPLSRLLTLALQCQGIAASVRVRFAENRVSERMRDAQADAIEIANESAKYAAGWTSQNEASQAVTGHASDQAEPRSSLGGAAPPPAGATQNPEPSGTNRARRRSGTRAKLVPVGAGEPFDDIPDVTITESDVDDAADLWDATMPSRVNGMLRAAVVDE